MRWEEEEEGEERSKRKFLLCIDQRHLHNDVTSKGEISGWPLPTGLLISFLNQIELESGSVRDRASRSRNVRGMGPVSRTTSLPSSFSLTTTQTGILLLCFNLP